MPVSPYIMKNNFLVLLRGNNCCTISDISAQYKRVQDYQAGSNGRTIQRAKLTVRCPHHPYCHCTLDPIPYTIVVSNAAAHSAYSKFDPYLFNTRGEHPHGKDKLFHEWGYTVVDAFWLQKEIERQAREKYVSAFYSPPYGVVSRISPVGSTIQPDINDTVPSPFLLGISILILIL